MGRRIPKGVLSQASGIRKKGGRESFFEQYERVGKSVISVGRKTQKSSDEFYVGEKVDESLLVL